MNMNRQELEAKLAELESDLKLWNAALSRKLEDSVRKTTLAFIQKGEALRTQYIEALADRISSRSFAWPWPPDRNWTPGDWVPGPHRWNWSDFTRQHLVLC